MRGTSVPSSEASTTRLDAVYSVLADRHRRFVVYYLASQEDPAEVGDLVDELAGLEAVVDGSAVDGDRRRELRTVLHHVHLPKLAAADVVTYEPDEGMVSLLPEGEYADAVRRCAIAQARRS